MNKMRELYLALEKPGFAPAPDIFGIVWAALYILIAIATILLIVRVVQARLSVWLVVILFINLVANILFTPLFTSFGLVAGLVDILIVLATAVWLQVKSWRHAWGVFVLLLPYTLWVGFASILQFSLVLLN
jgi:tryptophan-rich sensory protein